MLIGTAASGRLQTDYAGFTTHRRTVHVKSLLIDLHMRVRDSLVNSSAFGGEGYLSLLGQELGNMPSDAFDSLVEFFLNYLLTVTPDGGVKENTVLCQFPDDFGLYVRLTETALFRSLRYMMCKSHFMRTVSYTLEGALASK